MKWKRVKLSELVEEYSVRGKDIKESDKLEFYGVSNELGIINAKYSANDKYEDYKVIENGCFAYNPYRINVGSIALYTNKTMGLISPAYVVFITKPNSISPELLLKFLKSEEGLRQVQLYARGTVRQALRFDDLCKIELSIPDYDDQLLLYEKLNSIQTKSEHLINEFSYQQKLISNLRQQILQDAIQGKLVPQNPNDESAFILLEKIKVEKEKLIKEKRLKKSKPLPPIIEEEIPFDIPDKWVWCRLGEIANIEGRIGWKGLTASEYTKKGPLFISVYSLNYGDYVDFRDAFHISQERYDESPEIMLNEDDILICNDGAGIGKVGIVGELTQQVTINSSLLIIRKLLDLNHKYLYYLLLSPFFQKIVNSRLMGATTPHLYQRDISTFLIALPPLAEQKRIEQKVMHLRIICDELEREIYNEPQNLDNNLRCEKLKFTIS